MGRLALNVGLMAVVGVMGVGSSGMVNCGLILDWSNCSLSAWFSWAATVRTTIVSNMDKTRFMPAKICDCNETGKR